MGPSGSTLRGGAADPPGARALGAGPAGEFVALLLPMVRRSVRTRSGPGALVRWLQQQPAAPRRCDAPEPTVRRLTETLVRALLDGTLTDSRFHEDQAPAAS